MDYLRLARSGLLRLRGTPRPAGEVQVSGPGDLITAAHWIDKRPQRLLVAPSMLRMQGGFVYGPDHPFVRALAEGQGALDRFYADFQPRSLAAFHGLADGPAGFNLPTWELPWYGRRDRKPPPGEAGLSAHHGLSFHGPASPQKRQAEFRRLEKIAESIARHGYDPDGHGDIEGYALHAGGRVAFFVRGGKHRAAVLAHLGHAKIPVAFRSGFPRVIDVAQAGHWPLVVSGAMDSSFAMDLQRVYIDGRSPC